MILMDFKDYTRMRDIVRKRNVRLSEAGLSSLVHFPTVKEIKAGLVSPSEAMKAVKEYYSGGSTVKAVRQTGLVPEMKVFPSLPPEQKLNDTEKRMRKRASDRAYKRRKAVRSLTSSPEKQGKYESYLKALQTVQKVWDKAGFNLGLDLSSMTPSEAKSFVAYMDYRFSQGDFTAIYVIDQFIQDFSKLRKAGYKGSDIVSDFNKFLEKETGLRKDADNMEGMSGTGFLSMWDKFVTVATGV